MNRCGECGRVIQVGEWPYCPHGRIVSVGRHYSFDNYIDTNISDNPVEITSPGHRLRLMRENGLGERERPHINDLNHRRWQRGLPPLPR